MTNKINQHLLIYIPKLEQFTDRASRTVSIVMCIRKITSIGLKDAKGIVDNDGQWHKVPIYKHEDSVWQPNMHKEMLDKLHELGCEAWINDYGDTLTIVLPNVQDYMDTLGNLMEGATPKKDEVASNFRSRAMLVHELKHYIMQATEFREYKMAKYLIDQLANYEE